MGAMEQIAATVQVAAEVRCHVEKKILLPELDTGTAAAICSRVLVSFCLS